MKIEKNKIVFATVISIVLLFIIGYTYMVLGDEDEIENLLSEPVVPKLESEQETYSSKLDAINNIKEKRERNIPSLYNDELLDSLGYYDRDYLEKEKERIVDSIYQYGQIDYEENNYRNNSPSVEARTLEEIVPLDIVKSISAQEMGLEHQLFFASNPLKNKKHETTKTDSILYAEVDGTQVVKVNSRLQIRLIESAIINGIPVPKNTAIYGFISFQPNRAIIEIENINHRPSKLKAFDVQDGSEGIYIENSFRADATKEVVDDIIQDINIVGIPQISGIKKVFQRTNRNVKVTILNKYKLILKPQRGTN